MHPSVHSKDPGKCPICAMDLVPIMKKQSGKMNSGSDKNMHGMTDGAAMPTKADSDATMETKKDGKVAPDIDHWTCTMHPSVHSKDPGKCPICDMDLVPVMKKTNGSAMGDMAMPKPGEPNEFVVPVERQQQIGVTYATVEMKPLERIIRAVGMLEPDKTRDWQYVTRVDGYVQDLIVTSPGQIVEKGASLMSIYSPDLHTTERELVLLLRMRDQASTAETRETPLQLIEAAKRRLRQWNVTEEQIAALEKSRKPQENLMLLSPFRGVVQAVSVAQGKNVKAGDSLVQVTDLSVIWASARFYENELSTLKQGQKVTITSKSYPGETFEGTISLINPFIDDMTRTSKVRIDIANPDFKLRPGMYVDAELDIDMGQGLTVPVSAVMPTGTRNLVFLDKGEGKLLPRIVELGTKYGDRFEVKGGLKEGDRVVASANFLIDAESKVQGAIQSFEEPETPAMKGGQQ